MGLDQQQREETLALICSALADGLGFESDAKRWLSIVALPRAGEAPKPNFIE